MQYTQGAALGYELLPLRGVPLEEPEGNYWIFPSSLFTFHFSLKLPFHFSLSLRPPLLIGS